MWQTDHRGNVSPSDMNYTCLQKLFGGQRIQHQGIRLWYESQSILG
jgi:hypothetical protein